MTYKEVQQTAKDTIEFARQEIRAGMTLTEIRKMCESKLLELGADSFWYWDVGAFVFAGDDTTLSVSGREYKTSTRTIAETDIITVDLSPQKDSIWGDYARTLIVQNGRVADDKEITDTEWRRGIETEKLLHKEMRRFVKPETTFEELFYYMNAFIEKQGFKNLDFMGNLGHSIVKNKDERIYIEKGNGARLDSVKFFTFEPHISIPGSKFGFKRENIYYFADGKLEEL